MIVAVRRESYVSGSGSISRLSPGSSDASSLVVGIAWKVAVPADAPEIYNDDPIGNGRTGYEDAALGFSSSNGNATRWVVI